MTERNVEIGDKFMVSWRNGQKYVGEIIEIRPVRRIRDTSVGTQLATSG
jgi:hypothetical protein